MALVDEGPGLEEDFEIPEEAIEELARINRGESEQADDVASESGETSDDEEQSVDSEVEEQLSPEEELLGKGVSIDDLPDEVKPFAQQLLGDYTRKTQTAAELRKQFEGLGDPEQVRQAVDFVQQLQDPEQLVAFYQRLSEYLPEAGLLEVSGEDDSPPDEEQPSLSDGTLAALKEEYGEDHPLVREVETMRSVFETEISGLRSEWQAAQQAKEQAEIEADVESQLVSLRERYTHWSDEDFDDVINLAFAPEFVMAEQPLIAAAEALEAGFQRRVQRYIKKKGDRPTGEGPLPTSGHGEQPVDFSDDLEAAHKAAMERLAASLSD